MPPIDISADNFFEADWGAHLTTLGIGLIVGFMLVGCAGSNHRLNELKNSDDRILVQHVPFYPDDRYWCGPATLTALLNFHGSDVSIETVADKIYSKSAQGTITFDMVWYAEETGHDVVEKHGDLSDISEWLKRGHPVIVFTDSGNIFYSSYHYMVVIGLSEDKVIVNSGETQGKVLSREDFQSAWSGGNNWMMVVK
ncbi:MAG: C39 family peptidase [bacterium]